MKLTGKYIIIKLITSKKMFKKFMTQKFVSPRENLNVQRKLSKNELQNSF